MSTRNRVVKSAVIILFCGIAAFISGKYLTAELLRSKSPSDQSEGFDFNFILNSENLRTGPNVGEQIDLKKLKSAHGESLAETIREHPSIIVSVDSRCPRCTESAGSMRDIRTRVAPAGVQYYIVAFRTSGTSQDFFKFAESLDADAPARLWSTNDGEPPGQLREMLIPSHFLIDRNGIVMKKWPGFSAAESTRQRIANQIVIDTLNLVSKDDSSDN